MLIIQSNKTKVHLLVHHVQIKNLPSIYSKSNVKNGIESKPSEKNTICNLNIDENSDNSKKSKSENHTDLFDEYSKQKSFGSLDNENEVIVENNNERRKIFLQFSEPVSKQIYNTNSGYYDEICLRRPIITMTFTDAISKKTTIYIKMFDSLTNKLIAELPLPINIIPFDKKVSSKFRMINKLNEDSTDDSESLQNQKSFPNQKSGNDNNLMIKIENESENNLIDFDLHEKTSVSTNSSNFIDNSDISKNSKSKKTIPKIKLFLLIHLSTFGQLPFHAQKGTLLKHLKDATRINEKSFGIRKDAKDKSLSLNSIITPSPLSSNNEKKIFMNSTTSGPNQQRIRKTYDFEIFNSDKASSTLNINGNSNSSTEYSENNDSSSERVETIFIDNLSDQKDQQQIEIDKQNKQTGVFIDDFKKIHSHHRSHHCHHHSSNGHTHHHKHKHTHSNQANQLNQQNYLSDDQDAKDSQCFFNDKKQKNALLKVGSCGDIPAQCLLTDILVK